MFGNCLVLLSGGVGSRMGAGIPKQYMVIQGHMIIEHTLRAMLSWRAIDSLCIVADEAWRSTINDMLLRCGIYVSDHLGDSRAAAEQKAINGSQPDETVNPGDPGRRGAGSVHFLGYADPGINREMSVLNALHAIEGSVSDDAVIMIHDAVRPFVKAELVNRLAEGCNCCDGAMPYLPLKDTVYYTENGLTISGNLNRDKIIAGQTPEAYRFRKYLDAVETLSSDQLMCVHGTTEPAVLAGLDIVLIPGDEDNIKITTPEDLERFEEAMKRRGYIL